MAKKKCSWAKCWLTVWLWLSLVSPVRSSVVGVALWSAFKPGFLSLVPSDRRDGDVKLKGAHDLPSSAADACQCLGSLAMTWLLGFWVVLSSGSHKKIVGCFRSLGCFLDWFFPQGPVYEFPFWSARIVKQRRVKGIRKGWKRRLHERCRALHTLSPCVRFGQPSFSGNRVDYHHNIFGLGLPDVPLNHLGSCRGGARGNVSGKSNISGMEHELLNGLQKLLQQFNSQTFGGDNVKGKGVW